MCSVDKYGFPRTSAKSARVVKGFRTGDIVRLRCLPERRRGRTAARSLSDHPGDLMFQLKLAVFKASVTNTVLCFTGLMATTI